MDVDVGVGVGEDMGVGEVAGGGVPVVLVHALRTSRTMWRPQLAALDAAGRRALAIDLPGHGRRVGEDFTIDGAVRAVADGVDAVGGRALVVGLSLGGYTAIAHAARHPEQVAGLVAASCCTRPFRPVVAGWHGISRALLTLPDRGAAFNDVVVGHMLPAAAMADASAGGWSLEVMTSALAAMAGADPVGDLGQIDAPVWLVNGRFDHFRGEERRFLAACRDGRLVVVPGAPHFVSLVRPERFTRAIFEALDEVEAREAARVAAARTGRLG